MDWPLAETPPPLCWGVMVLTTLGGGGGGDKAQTSKGGDWEGGAESWRSLGGPNCTLKDARICPVNFGESILGIGAHLNMSTELGRFKQSFSSLSPLS